MRIVDVPCLHAGTVTWKERKEAYVVDMREVDSLVASGVSIDIASSFWPGAVVCPVFRFGLPLPVPPSGDIGVALRLRALRWDELVEIPRGDRRECVGMVANMYSMFYLYVARCKIQTGSGNR